MILKKIKIIKFKNPLKWGIYKLPKGKYLDFKNEVLEINEYGILKKKSFYNIDDMRKIKIVDETTEAGFRKTSFIYDFMSSMRQKINDPLGQRAKKRKKINQQ